MITVESELFDKARHFCRRCDRQVERVFFTKKETGEVLFDVRCHHDRVNYLASRSELEDSKVLEYFDALPVPEQQTLSESASLLFNITAALEELLDQRLVAIKPGALLPSLSRRGREYRDHRNAERVRRFADE